MRLCTLSKAVIKISVPLRNTSYVLCSNSLGSINDDRKNTKCIRGSDDTFINQEVFTCHF